MKLLNAIKTTAFFTVIFLISITMISCADEADPFNTWDDNDDSYINDGEFDTALEEIGYYDDWDADGDDFLTEDEWDEGFGQYLSVYDSEEFSEFAYWDADGDGMLSEQEFEDLIFDIADSDDDDQVDADEFHDWYDEGEF